MKQIFIFRKTILLFIIVLAAIFRFWNLEGVPPSISMDEASIGYNAYAVLHTGADEYKEFPLVSQRAFDDWRRSTYLLLVVPSVGIFGLTDTAVRFPAALLSVLAVWAFYYIVLLLFKKETPYATGIALFASFLLSITPWHVYISRLGHESNASLSFLVFGIFFFLQGIHREKAWKLFVCVGFFALSMISYYVGQVFIPLFGIGLLIVYREKLWSIFSKNKILLLSLVVSIILLIPVFWSVFSPSAMVRFGGTSTFSPAAHWDFYTQEVTLHNNAALKHDYLGLLVHHRYLFPMKVLFSAYLIHFDPFWLFSNPSNKDGFKAPHMGLLYLWELPCILLGIGVLLLTKKIDWKEKSLVFLWFFLGPLPAAIAVGVPHANRSYTMVTTWEIFAALGVGYLVYQFRRLRIITCCLVGVAIFVGVLNFSHNYFVVFPKEQSNSFYYAFSQMMPYVLSRQNNYQHIVFSNTGNMYQSYMGYLWYSRYAPATYQKMGGTHSGGYAVTHSIGKYTFRPINWTKDQSLTDTLLVGNIEDFPKKTPGVIFTNLDGKTGIKIVSR